MMHRPVWMLALLATACQQAPQTAPDAAAGGQPSSPAVPAPVAAPSPAPEAPSAEADAAAEQIPAAFHGRWGMVPADCTSTRGDAKGLLTIDGQSLRFYESRAVPTDPRMTAPGSWTAVLAFEGEGQRWTEPTTLTLADDGQTLTRAAEQSFTYRKCPA